MQELADFFSSVDVGFHLRPSTNSTWNQQPNVVYNQWRIQNFLNGEGGVGADWYKRGPVITGHASVVLYIINIFL